MNRRESLERGRQHFKREADRYRVQVEQMEHDPKWQDHPMTFTARIVSEAFDKIAGCIDEGKPFIAGWYCAAPEIYVAMDLPWYTIMQTPFLPVSRSSLLHDIDETEKMGLGNDMCTAIRLSMYGIEVGLTPPPTAIVGLIHPCDGVAMLHNVVEHNKVWRDIPIFACDPPYFDNDRSMGYATDEVRRMVSFLEEHTRRKLDIDRLREVVEESNSQYELWGEYSELRRAVPCPHGWGIGVLCSTVAQNFAVGDPRGTAWFRNLVADAELRVREKRGWLPNERIRLLWFDIMPQGWKGEIISWFEEEWGANFVMDMMAYTPYTLIDTANEETMFRGLAKRALCDTYMVRQARGLADNFIDDIVRIVKDYKIDCVFWPGHMGHKDQSAAVGIMREVCRDLGVAFLTIGVDLYDTRYTPPEVIKDKASQFFTAMGLG